MYKINQISSSGFEDYDKSIFSWELNNVCQYRCSYCYANEWLEKDFNKKYSDTYKTVLTKIKLLDIKKINYDLELLGGEPTIHPYFFNILSFLNNLKKCKKIKLITNIAKPVSFFNKIPNYIDKSKYTINASYHVEYDKGNFLKKIIELNKNHDVVVNVNLLNNEKYFDKIEDIIKKFISNDIKIMYNYLHDVENKFLSNYDEVFYNKFEKYFKYFNNKKTKFIIDEKEIYLDEWYIRKNNLINFYDKFLCTPKFYNISYKGEISNICTGKQIKNILNNFHEKIKCPVKGGCSKCSMLFDYHKERC
tara:strand:- start:110 stop:1027 length:918 start_codon:yes stop_codon:yes gene_type:complete